jgi:hypothetical protein
VFIDKCFFQFNDAKQFSKNVFIGSTKSVTIRNTSFYDFPDLSGASAQNQSGGENPASPPPVVAPGTPLPLSSGQQTSGNSGP